MGRGHSVDLGFQVFENKDLAELHFSNMLSRYRPGDVVEQADSAQLMSLVMRHYDSQAKIGCGVAGFAVIGNRYGGKCFVVVRRDDSSVDFSIGKCIKGVPNSPFQNVAKAFRHLIDDYMVATRRRIMIDMGDDLGFVPCAITGRKLAWQDAHLDHAHPKTFEKIVEAFLLERQLAPEDIKLRQSSDVMIGKEVADKDIAADFFKYHAAEAVLRLIAKEENLKIGPKLRDRNHTWAA